jgi:hypothetical protein
MAREASMIAKGVGNRQVTPLVIVLSFILLTEMVVMVGVLGTRDLVQAILCIFCVLFPVALAVPFFWILYHKPYVFYGPREYGSDVDPERYITAFRAQASISSEWQKIISDLPQIVTRALSSGSAAHIFKESVGVEARTDLSQELGRGIAEEINKREIFHVDVTEFGGKTLYIPAYVGMTVGDFLDTIWFELSNLDDVPSFQYGTAWILENASTGRRYENIGTRWALANGLDRDNRLLKDVAIAPNIQLRAVDLRRSTKRGRPKKGGPSAATPDLP